MDAQDVDEVLDGTLVRKIERAHFDPAAVPTNHRFRVDDVHGVVNLTPDGFATSRALMHFEDCHRVTPFTSRLSANLMSESRVSCLRVLTPARFTPPVITPVGCRCQSMPCRMRWQIWAWIGIS